MPSAREPTPATVLGRRRRRRPAARRPASATAIPAYRSICTLYRRRDPARAVARVDRHAPRTRPGARATPAAPVEAGRGAGRTGGDPPSYMRWDRIGRHPDPRSGLHARRPCRPRVRRLHDRHRSDAPAAAPLSLPARVLGVLFSPRETFAQRGPVPALVRGHGRVAARLSRAPGVVPDAPRSASRRRSTSRWRRWKASGMTVTDAQYSAMKEQAQYTPVIQAVAILVMLADVHGSSSPASCSASSRASLGGQAHLQAGVRGRSRTRAVLNLVQALVVTPLNYFRGSMSSATTCGSSSRCCEEGSFLANLLGTIDLFILWSVVLLSIGLAVLYRTQDRVDLRLARRRLRRHRARDRGRQGRAGGVMKVSRKKVLIGARRRRARRSRRRRQLLLQAGARARKSRSRPSRSATSKAVVSASGKIQAKRSVNISADTMGRVTDLAVEEGDIVKQGQFLLQIDPRNLQSAFQRGEAGRRRRRGAARAAPDGHRHGARRTCSSRRTT